MYDGIADIHTWRWRGAGERHTGKLVPGLEVFECQSDNLGFPWEGMRMCKSVASKPGGVSWRPLLRVNVGFHGRRDGR